MQSTYNGWDYRAFVLLSVIIFIIEMREAFQPLLSAYIIQDYDVAQLQDIK